MIQEKNWSFRIQGDLKDSLSNLYGYLLPNLFSGIHRLHMDLAKQVVTQLSLKQNVLDEIKVNEFISQHLVVELAYPFTTSEIIYLEKNFGRFKELTNIPFQNVRELIAKLKPKVQRHPFVRHIWNGRDKVLFQIRCVTKRLGALLGEKPKKIKII